MKRPIVPFTEAELAEQKARDEKLEAEGREEAEIARRHDAIINKHFGGDYRAADDDFVASGLDWEDWAAKKERDLPARTADTMSDAIAMSSPNGRQSKRSQETARQRLSEALFGKGGLQLPKAPKEDEATRLRRNAKQLRDLAARGMHPRAGIKEAMRLEAEADKLDAPEKYALPAQFVESKHPRGKPDNAGQFRPKGAAAGGQAKPKPAPKPTAAAKPAAVASRRVKFKGKAFNVTQSGVDWFYRPGGATTAWTKANMATAAALDKALGQGKGSAPQTPPARSAPAQHPNHIDVPADSDNVLVNAVAVGQGKYLGAGQEGMVFAVAGRAVKVSRAGSDKVAREAAVSEAMRKAGVHGMMKTQLVQHAGRDFAIRDQLAIPSRFSPSQLEEARRSIAGMHAKGFSLNDRVQMGLDQYGRMMHYDVGKAAKLPEDGEEARKRILADEHALGAIYRASGQQMPPFGQSAQSVIDSFAEAMSTPGADIERTAQQAIVAAQTLAKDNPKAGAEAIRTVNKFLSQFGLERIAGPGSEDEPAYNPKTQRGEAIESVAEEYGVKADHLAQVAADVHKEMSDFAKDREAVKEQARKSTHLTSKDLAYLENKGYDYAGAAKLKNKTGAKFRGFDNLAQQIARHHPGMIGDPDDPGEDFAANLWDLLREGKQDVPGPDDPEILKTAGKRLLAMGASEKAQQPAEEAELVPFARRGIVAKYRLWSVHNKV